MKLVRLRSASLILPLSLALALAADEVAFHPSANAAVAKELEVDVELAVSDFSFSVNGEELPPEALGPIGDQKLLVHLVLGVTDKYVATKDGRPIDLLRTYDDVRVKAEFGEGSKETDGDDFKGKTVRFVWNEETHEYDKSWHESKDDVAKLENLTEDMDLRLLLPPKKVAVGDTWDVPGANLLPLFMPGGVASGDGDTSDNEEMTAVEEELKGQFAKFLEDFKVVCKYAGQRDDAGVRVAEIHFTFEGTPKLDLAPVIQRIAQLQEGAPDADVTASLSAQFKGEGSLLWNQAAGHVHAFDMQSDISLDANVDARASEEGESYQIVISAAANGKATWKMSAKDQ